MICYHCTEKVLEQGRWQVHFDGERRQVCCAGCMAIMQAIVDAELGDYYRFRTERAAFGVIPDDLSARLDELAVFDEPEISERYLQEATDSDDSSAAKTVNLSVEGVRCGACVWVLERAVQAQPGVLSVSVNYSSARASVTFEPGRIKLSGILGRIARVGYKAVPFDARERELALRRESRVFLQRLFISGIATMQVMMYALPGYLSEAGEIDPAHEGLLRWASLLLTTPVILYSAQPFIKGALRDIVNRQPGMDVPVSIALVAAFSASVWATVTGIGEIYFDSVAMFVFLLLGARYLEWSARRRATRVVDAISSSAPDTAQLIVGSETETVPAVRLAIDDKVLVGNGERIPVDGVVLTGDSSVDNSLVTGESLPETVGPGDTVAGGSLLCGAPVTIRVLRRQSASTLSVIDRMIQRGASEKPTAVRLADQIAAVFVSLLLVFALAVWLFWLQFDADRAASTAIAVLVVSCPCALSMATPAALAAATGDLLRQRLLITRGHALETLARVTDVVFDKTGTVTLGVPSLTAIDVADGMTRERALKTAAALEAGSSHPYAKALQRALSERGLRIAGTEAAISLAALGFDVVELEHKVGFGIRAELAGGQRLCLGSRRWCELEGKALGLASDNNDIAAGEVFLSLCDTDAEGEVTKVESLARFVLVDELRPEILDLTKRLRNQGKSIHLLSGDRAGAVESMAKQLNTSCFKAAATPEEKQAYVSRLQAGGSTVLMVGDGINDAPVLASASVSLAAGDATALARTAADIISLQPGLQGLELLLRKAQQTNRIVRQNMIWAASYNTLAIPLAAMGYIPPWAAAVGMAGSSLLVVANAQRLWGGVTDARPKTEKIAQGMLWNRFSY